MIFSDSLVSINVLVNKKLELQINEYKEKGKEIKYKRLIQLIHKLLEENRNITLKHCYSHMSWKDKISEGNNNADVLAS